MKAQDRNLSRDRVLERLDRNRMMDVVREITARFPLREYEIYRLCLQSARFKAICADYELAATALRRWQKIEGEADNKGKFDGKANEYNAFIRELADEILEELDRARPSTAEPGAPSRSEGSKVSEPRERLIRREA